MRLTDMFYYFVNKHSRMVFHYKLLRTIERLEVETYTRCRTLDVT